MIFDQQKLDRCISCGYCIPACPTYKLTGREESSPRGRITLMRAVQDGRIEPAQMEAESKFCLGCRACEPVCPAGVEFGYLMEEARNEIWRGMRRPFIVRALFIALYLLKIKNFLIKEKRTNSSNYLMLGCFEQIIAPNAAKSLCELDPSIQIKKPQNCCGALHAHNGELQKGKEMALKMGKDLPGRIITTSAGCAAHLAQYIGKDRVTEFSQYALEANFLNHISKQKLRIGFQDSCHGRNGLGIWQEPREIISQIGEYIEVPGADNCCGAAGTYSLINKENSQKVNDEKIKVLKELNLDYLVTINPGCTRQLKAELKRNRIETEVVHLASLIKLVRDEN